MGHHRTVGEVVLTDFRLVLMCHDDAPAARAPQNLQLVRGQGYDLSTSIPLGTILEVVASEESRVSHRVAKDASRPAGRQMKTMNASRELIIRCRDFRTITLIFTENCTQPPAEFAGILHRRLLTASLNSSEVPIATKLGCVSTVGWDLFDITREMKRQGINDSLQQSSVSLSRWTASAVNVEYGVCLSYPAVVYVPRLLDEDTVRGSAAFRAQSRFPALCFYNRRRQNALVRCGQPLVGVRGRRSEPDENFIKALRLCSAKSDELFIFDARSSLAVEGNKLMGKGTESPENYENTKLINLDIANIHAVRASYDELREVCEVGSDQKWQTLLESTGWLAHIRSILLGATRIAKKLESTKSTCMVHCSDGWDRTSQLTALVQLFLDPYFRTIEGFIVLIEKEWLSFGHRFQDRHYRFTHERQRSPIFLQFIDCVWQTMNQFPAAFEFNSKLLILILDQLWSFWFGTFLWNNTRHRRVSKTSETTTALWTHVLFCRGQYLNTHYDTVSTPEVVLPRASLRWLCFWNEYYLRYDNLRGLPDDNEDDSQGTLRADRTAMQSVVVWIHDRDSQECSACRLPFTWWFRRRHHCRACGKIFCADCSEKRISLPDFNYPQPERVCDACFKKYSVRAPRRSGAMAYEEDDPESEDDDSPHASPF
eukprot:m.494517 g.494517  ORF g.494517 m.494517 type:complete len:655 (+) comp57289_c0_seq2:1597-3561(+)